MFYRYKGKHVVTRAIKALSVRARIGIATGTLAVLSMAGLVLATNASASATDCLSSGYDCTPGYNGSNASPSWAWTYYGGTYAATPNGYHNCTLYAAWRLSQNGMADPRKTWGNAKDWASNIGGGDHTPAVGSIAWWGVTSTSPYGHVAYVEQVSGSNVYIRADNWSSSAGYTDAGWVAASSVGLFLHPHDVGGSGDLFFIKTKNTGSGHVEVHSATAASGYQSGVHYATWLSTGDADNGWFQMVGNDLFFIKTKNTGSGHVEVHSALASSGYQTAGVHAATWLSTGDQSNGWFQISGTKG